MARTVGVVLGLSVLFTSSLYLNNFDHKYYLLVVFFSGISPHVNACSLDQVKFSEAGFSENLLHKNKLIQYIYSTVINGRYKLFFSQVCPLKSQEGVSIEKIATKQTFN